MKSGSGIITTDMTTGVQEKYDNLIANGLTIDKRWGTPQGCGKGRDGASRGEYPRPCNRGKF